MIKLTARKQRMLPKMSNYCSEAFPPYQSLIFPNSHTMSLLGCYLPSMSWDVVQMGASSWTKSTGNNFILWWVMPVILLMKIVCGFYLCYTCHTIGQQMDVRELIFLFRRSGPLVVSAEIKSPCCTLNWYHDNPCIKTLLTLSANEHSSSA